VFGGWIFKKNSRHAVYVSNSQCLVYESLKRRTNDYYVYIVHLINRTIAEHGKGTVHWNVYFYICNTNLYTKCIGVMSNELSCSFSFCLTTILYRWRKSANGAGLYRFMESQISLQSGRIYINRQWRCMNIFAFTQKTTKKSLKIPKGQSESVYRRRTDNTKAKRKKYKRTNNDLQNIHIKLKIE
jgi:hypothetical protein